MTAPVPLESRTVPRMSPVIDCAKREGATVRNSMTIKDRVTLIGTRNGGDLSEKHIFVIEIGRAFEIVLKILPWRDTSSYGLARVIHS